MGDSSIATATGAYPAGERSEAGSNRANLGGRSPSVVDPAHGGLREAPEGAALLEECVAPMFLGSELRLDRSNRRRGKEGPWGLPTPNGTA
ncbi:MAG: hypothetical protein L3J93_01845 [Thermoplasmata archaeon]|nr:hypothetical protein [Thermoplasmata archaeon]